MRRDHADDVVAVGIRRKRRRFGTELNDIGFYGAMLRCRRASARLSVCLSVTRRYCIKTAKHNHANNAVYDTGTQVY